MAPKNRNFHNPQYKEKKRKLLIWQIVIFFIVLLALIGSFAGLTHWSRFSIDTVMVDGAYVLSPDEIKAKTFEIISHQYLSIFSEKNAVLYPKQEVIDTLLKEYPRIKTIDVNLADYHTLVIQISERQPTALWCDTTPGVIASSSEPIISPHCYFMDNSGFVYSESPNFSGDAYFKYYGLLPYGSAIGSKYLSSPDTFMQLSEFVSAIKALKITPLYIVATTQADFTMYIYGGGQIIFDDKTPLSTTAHNLQLLLQTANLVPQKNGELLVEYIDLRYGNKLYYKVRQ